MAVLCCKVFLTMASDTFGYIYLVQLKDVKAASGGHLYKVGRTSRPKDRLASYQGALCLLCIPVVDMYTAEQEAIRQLSTSCTLEQGREFFSGPLQAIMQIVSDIVIAVCCEAEIPDRLIKEEELKPKIIRPRQIPGKSHNTPEQVTNLLQANDLSDDEYTSLLLEDEHDELDEWALYKYEYKQNAGVIGDLTIPFVEAYGTEVVCPALLHLQYILMPDYKHLYTVGRNYKKRAELVADVLDALGMKSPFDTETVIPDLMQLWTSTIKHTKMFRNYAEYKSLFNSCRPSKCDWDLKSIVKAVNMVLGSAGIAIANLKREQKVINGKWVSTYKYRLDEEKVQLMMELFKMKSSR